MFYVFGAILRAYVWLLLFLVAAASGQPSFIRDTNSHLRAASQNRWNSSGVELFVLTLLNLHIVSK